MISRCTRVIGKGQGGLGVFGAAHTLVMGGLPDAVAMQPADFSVTGEAGDDACFPPTQSAKKTNAHAKKHKKKTPQQSKEGSL